MVFPLSDNQPIFVQILVNHVPGFATAVLDTTDAQTLALADGMEHQALVLPQRFSFDGNDFTWLCGKITGQKIVEFALPDEADAGAVFFGRVWKPFSAAMLAYFRFVQFAERKQAMVQRPLCQAIQEIALIFVVVHAL